MVFISKLFQWTCDYIIARLMADSFSRLSLVLITLEVFVLVKNDIMVIFLRAIIVSVPLLCSRIAANSIALSWFGESISPDRKVCSD